MRSFPLQKGILDCTQTSPSLPARRVHTAATMKASPAFLKTKKLFEDDRRYALRQVHASSCQVILAAPAQAHRHSQDPTDAAQGTQQHTAHSSALFLARTRSDSSTNSMADSVSSYHGYAGVNYQSSEYCTLPTMLQTSVRQSFSSYPDVLGYFAGIKDIDAVPNQWGYSLNDYKAVFGDKYVHGCVPWEDEHISKQDHKKFEKLHARRVQLLQELHGVEQGIRELMK